MSRIRRSSIIVISALSILLGILISSSGHSVPAAPHASAAITRVSAYQAQMLIDRSWDVVVQPATFIHHMIIGGDSAGGDSRQVLLITC